MNCLFLVAAFLSSVGATQTTSGRMPTLTRLDPANLAAVQQDIAKLKTQRQRVQLKSPLNDYRCILHAHSYLSHDSRMTIPEIAEAANEVGVDAVFLTNHPRQTLDVVTAGQTGVVDGVLFVPGSEANGFLLYPGDGKLPPLNVPAQTLIDSINQSNGLVFVAHPEEHKDWNLTGLTGMEIYNTHADFKDEKDLPRALNPLFGAKNLFEILNAFKQYPRPAFAALGDEPRENLTRYDSIVANRPFAAIAANDTHQNTGFVFRGAEGVKVVVEDPLGDPMLTVDPANVPELKALGEAVPGKELARYVLDPYAVSLGYVSTHVLAKERTKEALWQALREGRTYVAFDWLADPKGTVFVVDKAGERTTIGSTVKMGSTRTLGLLIETPVPCEIRLVRDGKRLQIGHMDSGPTRRFVYLCEQPGNYRFEAYLNVGGERRPWIYSGVIRVVR